MRSGPNHTTIATSVARLFFPQSRSLGIDRGNYSPSLLHKITYAGANKTSFREGSADLLILGELTVPEKQVERLSKRMGGERLAERQAEVEQFQQLNLMQRCTSLPDGVQAPTSSQVAVVMADAGMMQLRDPLADTALVAVLPLPTPTAATSDIPLSAVVTPAASAAPADSAAAATAGETSLSALVTAAATVLPADATAATPVLGDLSLSVTLSPATAPGTETAEEEDDDDAERRPSGRHWHEDKVGLVLTMASEVHQADPCPEIPESFVDPQRIARLVRGLKKNVAVGEDGLQAAADTVATPLEYEYEGPKLQTRTVVASRTTWPAFGPLLASAAWHKGFAQAQRKAFVADGSQSIWKLWQRHFSAHVPILDFIHALSYVFAAAMAVGGDVVKGWPLYVQWITWLWQGQVAQVVADLTTWQQEQGATAQGDQETSASQVVQRAVTYFTNHQGKMKYDEYRRQGLPLVSSLMESMVKQINRRVKGTEKFWGEEGAEAILQLRADYLSDGEVMEAFWERRQTAATGQRPYRKAV
jgi:hypothetical protein